MQSWIMLQTVPEAQKKAMRMTALISPATTFVIAIIAPSGLGLYFLVGGIIFVIQQIIVSYVMTPRIRRNIDAELDKKPVVEVVTKDVINNLGRTAAAGATASNTNESLEKLHERNRRRNAGKQQRPTRK
ncbi:inner membrane protein translocase component YidC, OxaA protein [Agrilactobacillus composti DSM 18527 = JCM 14202]|nr:inner membrane protein translocase component YidC, OxaA protein [Agrilactobacillus composti DSM 18527 = JCM 14202]